MADLPPASFDLFTLLDTLAGGGRVSRARSGEERPAPAGPDGEEQEPARVLREALAGEGGGRVFRVKLGYNPNSSSLGTSVVVLLWGVGLAGVLFQLVGSWLIAASERQSPPPGDEP